ncbi:hypothetical protein NDU88_005844 [Pleurodeles waltl]|uniref:Uncharacterized protein n=1 Tax=Pleurodeles waltl TaxID=8319 RepID=A0AAV7TXR0_PLEWA|nr:hypothetical protein NDU88_005844 [Pleurodeles waltl]
MFPAILRVVTKSGTQFFGTAEETCHWIDAQTTGDREHSPENPQPDRKGKNRQNKTGRLGSPTPLEILKERQKAMEAGASMNGLDHGSIKQSQEDLEHSESEQESEFSHSSDKQGPDVTPGTSDNII